ncbi:MAG: twin-arginine translocase TatA/TatE family subunit [Myxococcota bacterium]
MLNLGLPEILIILVLALVVIGPERLPELLRFLGRQYGRLTRASNELRRAFMLEAERDEVQKRAEAMRKRREEARRRIEEQRRIAEENATTNRPDVGPVGQTTNPFGAEPDLSLIHDPDTDESGEPAADSLEEEHRT